MLLTSVVVPPKVLTQQDEQLKNDLGCRVEERLQEVIKLERRMLCGFGHRLVSLVSVLIVEKRLNAPENFSRKSKTHFVDNAIDRFLIGFHFDDSPVESAKGEK